MMIRRYDWILFFIFLLILLIIQFRDMLGPGHYLYLAVVEDPAARWSFLPWDMLSARELRGGHFPLWNPYSGTGVPLLANLQSSVFMPLKWLFFACHDPRMLDLFVILRIALAGTFAFLLCRELGISRSGSLLGGAVLALTGYFMKHMNMVNVSSEMWMPLLMLLILKQGSRPRLLIIVVSGLAWAMVLTGGNPEAAFYVTVLVSLFAFVMGFKKRPFSAWIIVSLVLPFLLGSLLSSAQSLPFLEYLARSFHIHDPNLHKAGAFPPRMIGSLVAPWLLGPSGSHPDQIMSSPYLGIAPLLLALLALVHPEGRTRPALFFAGIAAVLLAIIYKLPPLGLIELMPPFNRMGNVKFAMAGVTLGAAVLSGTGLDVLRSASFRGRKTALAIALPAILLVGSGFYYRSELGGIRIAGFIPPFVSLLVISAVFVFNSVTGARYGTSKLKRLAGIAVIGVCIIELMIHFLGFRIKSEFLPGFISYDKPSRPEAIIPIADDPGLPRFTGIDGALHHNLNLIFALHDLRSFDGMYPYNYVKIMGEIEGFTMDEAVENFFSHGWSFDVRTENLDHPLIDVLGVKYVASEEEIKVPGFIPIREGTIRIYQNLEAYPRAWLANDSGGIESNGVDITHYSWDRVEISATGPVRVILSDTHFPGWTAMKDGVEVRIDEERGLVRAVNVEAGEQRIEMTYRPWSFRVGVWASAACLFAMGLILVSRLKSLARMKYEMEG